MFCQHCQYYTQGCMAYVYSTIYYTQCFIQDLHGICILYYVLHSGFYTGFAWHMYSPLYTTLKVLYRICMAYVYSTMYYTQGFIQDLHGICILHYILHSRFYTGFAWHMYTPLCTTLRVLYRICMAQVYSTMYYTQDFIQDFQMGRGCLPKRQGLQGFQSIRRLGVPQGGLVSFVGPQYGQVLLLTPFPFQC